MNSVPSRAETLFSEALALPETERGTFLARACGDDVDLLAHLDALLAAHESPDNLLERWPLLCPEIPEEKSGDTIGRYRLREKLGEGGCGAVWAAEQQEPMKRRVALKIIKLGMDTRQVITRFEVERQALAMMEHPNIAKMLDAGATETGRPYFVMELVRGIPITAYCDENHLTTTQRLNLVIKVGQAIQHAHQKGIIHRDIKPSNVLVTLHDGEPVPKVIDFGIAKATQQALTETTVHTQFQQFIGTPAYMSPEQAEMNGLDLDTRSDVYSLGVLLYELLTGRTPFDSRGLLERGVDALRRVIRETEPPRPSTRIATLQDEDLTVTARRRSTEPRKLVASVRGDLDWIVMKCLEKDRTRRYDTATGLALDVQRYLTNEPVIARPPSTAYRVRKFIRRHRVGVSAAATVISVVVVGSAVTTAQAFRALRAERAQNELREAARHAEAAAALARRSAEEQQQRLAKIRWARETALPEINRLIKRDDVAGAFALAGEAEAFIPDDPALANLWPLISTRVTIETVPSGADIYMKPAKKLAAEWEHLGKSPVKDIRVPRSPRRWRIERAGYAAVETGDVWWWLVADTGMHREWRLDQLDAAVPGMVRVQCDPAIPASLQFGDYWIDKHEVTNREFKEFVDRGGYATERFWKIPFNKGGQELSWAAAMAMFRDRTGRLGPATWANGTYPENESAHPVTGVSWFEAAAYAEFVGKRLPAYSQWRWAANREEAEYVTPLSNFGSQLAPVGFHQGVCSSGAFDMGGNAKEWVWNEADGGARYILGGGVGEPEYMFKDADAQSPFDRSARNGFRCARPVADAAVQARLEAPRLPAGMLAGRREDSRPQPVSDDQFEAIRRRFAYDRENLDPRFEGASESLRWRREKVSFNVAYSRERMAAYVFLPRDAPPPYQPIMFFPGASAVDVRSSEILSGFDMIEALIGARRAVIYPVYRGTYERALSPVPAPGSVEYREWGVHVVQDARRAIDYLETRSDIATTKLAFVGTSWGALMGPLISAIDHRIKVNILVAGGLGRARFPETDASNFAPRMTAPTLMLNGRHDYTFPLTTSQQPLFQLLGTAAEHKRHVLFDAGHGVSVAQTSPEIAQWLDRYLGPVK